MADEQLTEEQIEANEAEAAAKAEAEKHGSDQQKSESKGPDGWIPKVRLDEVLGKQRETEAQLQKEREERIRLEERLKPKETKAPTRAELLQAVEVGQITQAQADDAWERHIRESVRSEITEDLKKYESAKELTTRVKTELDQYTQAYPNVLTHGTEDRSKVEAEFQYLRARGLPDTQSTELAALRNVFGPLSRKNDMTQQRRETHQETSGEKSPETQTKTPELPARYKTHYQSMIDKGLYKGWEDPVLVKELSRVPRETLNARSRKYS